MRDELSEVLKNGRVDAAQEASRRDQPAANAVKHGRVESACVMSRTLSTTSRKQ